MEYDFPFPRYQKEMIRNQRFRNLRKIYTLGQIGPNERYRFGNIVNCTLYDENFSTKLGSKAKIG
jgi:hypothetical protein